MRQAAFVHDIPSVLYYDRMIRFGKSTSSSGLNSGDLARRHRSWSHLTEGMYAGTAVVRHTWEDGAFQYFQFELVTAMVGKSLENAIDDHRYACAVLVRKPKDDGPTACEWDYPRGAGFYLLDPFLPLMQDIQTSTHDMLKKLGWVFKINKAA